MNTQQTDKWLYYRCSTSHQDFEGQRVIMQNYFSRMGMKDNMDRLPRIEDFAQKRDKKITEKNVMLQLYRVPDESLIYCSELTRLGDGYDEISIFLKVCFRKKIIVITCNDGREINKKNDNGELDAITIFINSALSFASSLELQWKRERCRAGIQAYISKGGKCGRANPNYAKNIDPEQHKENVRRGNITRAKNKNSNYVLSEDVSIFCRELESVRHEFKPSNDESKLTYEDFWKVKIRMTGEDYVNLIENMKIHNKITMTYMQAQNKFHTIMKALRAYAKYKNELVLI